VVAVALGLGALALVVVLSGTTSDSSAVDGTLVAAMMLASILWVLAGVVGLASARNRSARSPAG
jgi:hypothetical protein